MELTATEKRRAGTAIEYTFREFSKDGGLRELQTKTDAADQTCASHIYSLAQFAVKNTKNLELATEKFQEMCGYAETGYKDKHKVANLKDVLPVWSVYKSNIVRGMKLGLSPLDHETEGAFRLAVGESLRESVRNIATDVAPAGTKQDSRLTVDDADTLLDSTSIHEGLRTLVAQLMIEAEYVRKGREAEAEDIVRGAVKALSELVDRRRITHKPTRTLISAHLH